MRGIRKLGLWSGARIGRSALPGAGAQEMKILWCFPARIPGFVVLAESGARGRQRRSQMQMSGVQDNDLLVRVARLERQNQVWKIAMVLILLAAVFLHPPKVRAQIDPGVREKNATVEARTFLLKDSAGNMRGKMAVDGDRHPVLEFYDLDGKVIWSTDSHAIPTK